MDKFLKIYLPFTRAGLQEAVIYRANFIGYFIGELIYCFVFYYIWRAVFHSSSEDTFMGFSMLDMVVFLFITILVRFVCDSDGTYQVGEEIRDGRFVMRIIKPVDFELTFLFQELGQKVTLIPLVFFPIIIGVEAYRYTQSGIVMFNIFLFAVFMVSILLAYMISFYLSICFGFIAFWLKNLWGISILKGSIINFLSGAVIPLAFMPDVLRSVLEVLPFASLSYTPVMIYMGKFDTMQILVGLGLQVFWLMTLFGLSKLIWVKAVKHLTSQGG